MTAIEIFDETEIFTEALGASVAQGNLTIAQLKRQLGDGLTYLEAQGADYVAEELLVALAALNEVVQRVTGPIFNPGADRFPAVDAPSVTAPVTLPGTWPKNAESANWNHRLASDNVLAGAVVFECVINADYMDAPLLNKKMKCKVTNYSACCKFASSQSS